jgi:NAD(P)-dependent dehydrogenase (short-subunit alcohol dehydrogenase family)
MVRQGWGRIINIASLATFVAFCEVAAYGASKSGVGGLTKSLAVELAQHGVCVNAIAPGFFPTALNQELLENTPRGREVLLRTPMHRYGRVEELVGTAVFLASESASFITGQILPVDGGYLASGVNQ